MKKVFIQLVLFTLWTSVCFAQKSETLVSWNFFTQTNDGVNDLKPSITNDNVTATGLIKGKGLKPTLMKNFSKYWGGAGFSFDKTGPEDGIAKQKFISFSFTNNSSKTLSLDEIKPMRIRIFSIGPDNFTIQYSLDGVAFTTVNTIKVDKPEKMADVITPAVKLSDVKDLQKLSSGKTVYFRIIPFGAKSNEYNDFYLGSSFDYAALTVTGNFK